MSISRTKFICRNFFNLKKFAAVREVSLSDKSCFEWFLMFKNCEDKKSSGRLKVYNDVDMEASLENDSCNTKEGCKTEENLTILHRLKRIFLHSIVTAAEKYIQKWKSSSQVIISISTANPKIHVGYLIDVVYGVTQPKREPLLGLSEEHHWWYWTEYSSKNASIITPSKINFLRDKLVHMLRWSRKPIWKH